MNSEYEQVNKHGWHRSECPETLYRLEDNRHHFTQRKRRDQVPVGAHITNRTVSPVDCALPIGVKLASGTRNKLADLHGAQGSAR